MDNSIYIMLSRQTALFREMTVRATNIANSDTAGFQAQDVLATPFAVPDGKGKKMDFTNDVSTFRRTEQGGFKITGGPLDVAIKGKGYFSIETPLGTRYTRAGNFTIDGEGTLITASGYPVLDTSGQRIQFQQEDDTITIGERGNISVNGQERGVLGVTEFDNEQKLRPVGNTFFRADEAGRASETALIQQGTVETSNVSPVSEITRVISVSRSVNSTAKFIETMYDLQRKAGKALATSS